MIMTMKQIQSCLYPFIIGITLIAVLERIAKVSQTHAFSLVSHIHHDHNYYQPSLLLPSTSYLVSPSYKHKHLPTTLLFAGFGNNNKSVGTNKGKKKNANSSSTTSASNVKKKMQIKQRLLDQYGGDIAKGTEERIQKYMASLPPHIRSTAELYRKVMQFEAYMNSLTTPSSSSSSTDTDDSTTSPTTQSQLTRIPQQDIDGYQRAKLELQSLYNTYNITDIDMHNIYQKSTWDASADAKAAKSLIGQMPIAIEERVNKACSIVANVVQSAGKKRNVGRCLDVGCGYGTIVPNLLQAGLVPNQIVGVDLSSEMIRNAQERYDRGGIQFIACDFLTEFEEEVAGLFDGIIFCSSLHDFPDMKAAIQKASLLLNSGGKIVIVHAQGASHVLSQHKSNPVMVKRGLFTEQELKSMVDALGLSLEHAPAEPFSKRDEEEGYLAVLSKK